MAVKRHILLDSSARFLFPHPASGFCRIRVDMTSIGDTLQHMYESKHHSPENAVTVPPSCLQSQKQRWTTDCSEPTPISNACDGGADGHVKAYFIAKFLGSEVINHVSGFCRNHLVEYAFRLRWLPPHRRRRRRRVERKMIDFSRASCCGGSCYSGSRDCASIPYWVVPLRKNCIVQDNIAIWSETLWFGSVPFSPWIDAICIV